jgi:hypothetical protein
MQANAHMQFQVHQRTQMLWCCTKILCYLHSDIMLLHSDIMLLHSDITHINHLCNLWAYLAELEGVVCPCTFFAKLAMQYSN